MTMTIRGARPEDRAEWHRMRRALWDDCPDEQQVREMEEILSSDTEAVVFAERPDGGLCGFLEAALRSRADGCDSTPVGYIEGWFGQMASDAELWNAVSHQAHGALGYEETARLVLFKKDLA